MEPILLNSEFFLRLVCIDPTPPQRTGRDTRSIFWWSTTGVSSEIFFHLTGGPTKAKERSMSYYIPVVWCRDDNRWIHAFLKWNTALSRIWTLLIETISYVDNRYAKHSL